MKNMSVVVVGLLLGSTVALGANNCLDSIAKQFATGASGGYYFRGALTTKSPSRYILKYGYYDEKDWTYILVDNTCRVTNWGKLQK